MRCTAPPRLSQLFHSFSVGDLSIGWCILKEKRAGGRICCIATEEGRARLCIFGTALIVGIGDAGRILLGRIFPLYYVNPGLLQ